MISLFDFQAGIGTAATLDMEQLISYTRASLVDTVASLQNSDRGVISVSKVHEPLTKTHDIMDSAVSKWVGNTDCILGHLLDSAFRQCHEV